MSPELIAILAVGVALATRILTGQRSLAARIERVETAQIGPRERMPHLEGLREAIAHNRAA